MQERKRKDLSHEDIFYFSESRAKFLSNTISIVFSAILLVGAIVCLTQIADRSQTLRLGMIVLFTVLFAFVVALLTNARRAEIFGATAAYAAVLAVYVSGNLGRSTPSTLNDHG